MNQRLGSEAMMPSDLCFSLHIPLIFGVSLYTSFITVENGHQQLQNLTATKAEIDLFALSPNFTFATNGIIGPVGSGAHLCANHCVH